MTVNKMQARAKEKLQLKELNEKCKRLIIFHAATGNIVAGLQVRSGQNVLAVTVEDYVQVIHPKCLVGKGLRYVNNERLRKIVYSLFRLKAKNGVIYITKTSLCHLVEMYGLDMLALPIPIPNFIEISG
jgi:hypothetical protein